MGSRPGAAILLKFAARDPVSLGSVHLRLAFRAKTCHKSEMGIFLSLRQLRGPTKKCYFRRSYLQNPQRRPEVRGK